MFKKLLGIQLKTLGATDARHVSEVTEKLEVVCKAVADFLSSQRIWLVASPQYKGGDSFLHDDRYFAFIFGCYDALMQISKFDQKEIFDYLPFLIMRRQDRQFMLGDARDIPVLRQKFGTLTHNRLMTPHIQRGATSIQWAIGLRPDYVDTFALKETLGL